MALFKEKYSLGLDIGSSAIKFAKFRQVKDTAELCAFGISAVDLKDDLSGQLKKMPELGQAKAVNISLSGPSTVIRYVSFPCMSQSELKDALKFEAQKHIPFAIEEVSLDGCILKAGLPDNKMLVALAAAKKDLVTGRLKLMESAGLSVNALGLDSIALANAFSYNYVPFDDSLKNKAVALLNIGASLSSLSIIEGGIPRFSRDIQIAGSHITQRLAQVFTLDIAASETLKLNCPAEKAGEVIAAAGPVLANLTAEIRSSCDYYESQGQGNVTKVFLSGGTSKLSGIKEKLAELLGMEAEYWDPLKRMSVAGFLDAQALKSLSGQLAVAVGLGLPR